MSRRGRVLVGLAVGLGLFSACTTDDAQEVVVDDGDARALLGAAVENMQDSSGRFTRTISVDMPAMSSEAAEAGVGPWEIVVEGEFDGADLRAETSFPDGQGGSETVVVDGRTFQGFPEPAVVDGEEIAPPFDMAGREWIEMPTEPLDARMAQEAPPPSDLARLLNGTPTEIVGSLELLDDLVALDDVGVEEFDGVGHRRLEGRIPGELIRAELESSSWVVEGSEEPDQERLERIALYAAERIDATISVLVSREAQVRRLELVVADRIEEQYRECVALLGLGATVLTTEFRDLGAPIEIDAPDPATVVSFEELAGDGGGLLGGPEGPGMSEDVDPELRGMLEQEVRDGAALIGLDPATIASMSREDLEAAADRIWEARQDAPTIATALGEMNRQQLLFHVRAGMEREGVDPSLADGMTDEQLAGLIDAYMADPDLAQKVPGGAGTGGVVTTIDGVDPGTDAGLDDATDGMDMFEGCPA